jgi:hypothetical protein
VPSLLRFAFHSRLCPPLDSSLSIVGRHSPSLS